MKPHFHRVPVKSENSFSIRHERESSFGTVWHYHPELELHYLVKGKGVRFIGDDISNFSDGELILLGENLPHTWRAEAGINNPVVEVIVLHFLPDCLGSDLLHLPEAYLIPKLYEQAKKGLVISGEAKEQIVSLLNTAVHAQNLDRLISLLSIFACRFLISNIFYPTEFSNFISINFTASTANSRGNSLNTSLQKPFTSMEMDFSMSKPRERR